MRRTYQSVGVAVAALAVATTIPLAAPAAPTTPTARQAAHRHAAQPYDFNGDGFPELVTGLTALEVNGFGHAGGVVVYPSSKDGVSRHGRTITREGKGVPGHAEYFAKFGGSLESADFNSDGYADLAIGTRGDEVAGIPNAGNVTVLYGSRRGLSSRHAWSYTPGQGMADFGESLAAADFTGDGYPDLAVGATGAGMWSDAAYRRGAVMVLRGGRDGVTASVPYIIGADDTDWYFGSDLAVGRLHRGATADLVIAAGGDLWEEGGAPSASVTVASFRTDSEGRPAVLRQRLDAPVQPAVVAVGDVLGDRNPEVIVGEPTFGYQAPGEDTSTETGRVLVFPGTASGPASKPVRINRSTPGVPGRVKPYDHFGADLTVGDINRDGKDDLVVWAPKYHVATARDVPDIVLYGRSSGIAKTANRSYAFGATPRLFDFNQDGRLELAVARPAGATIYHPRGKGFTRAGRQLFPLADVGSPLTRPEDNPWYLGFLVLGRAH